MLLIDVINDFEFDGGEELLQQALPVSEPIVRLLQPEPADYFVLKPKHSGFYSTTLDVLLDYLQVRTLILTGVTGDICVLFTANDAYMRDYHLVIPSDCVASREAATNQRMLEHMERVLKADISPSSDLRLETLLKS